MCVFDAELNTTTPTTTTSAAAATTFVHQGATSSTLPRMTIFGGPADGALLLSKYSTHANKQHQAHQAQARIVELE